MSRYRYSLLLLPLLLPACSSFDTAALASKAEAGDAAACYEYGHRMLTGRHVKRDHKQALVWLEKAADKGNIRAAAALGACYAHGLGTAPDTRQARHWYGKAADAGHPNAELALGTHYLQKAPIDYKKAVTYLRYAAMHGSPDAAFLMALCYSQGLGVRKNDRLAIGWLNNAAERGHKIAINIILNVNQSLENYKKL